MKTWTSTDITKETNELSGRTIHEFVDKKGEWHDFYLVCTPERIAFGGACNAGFIESGYIEREEYETLDNTLIELGEELETYYNDGAQYTNRIVFNERM